MWALWNNWCRREWTQFYPLREARFFSKCGCAVGSLLFDYLSYVGVIRDEIHVADKSCSQNKKHWLLSLLSTMAFINIFGCKSVPLSFMWVGHSNFSPDSWFGVNKAELSRMEINCVLDIEQAVIESCYRESAGFMEVHKRPHVPKFIHGPFKNTLISCSFNMNELHSKHFRSLVGKINYLIIIVIKNIHSIEMKLHVGNKITNHGRMRS